MSQTLNHPAELEVQTHPILRRIAHWLLALSILIMIGSGWRIYNTSPIFPFSFPETFTLGGDGAISIVHHNDGGVANAIAWHFAAMWLLGFAALLYIAHTVLTGHFHRDFFPVGPKSFLRDFLAAATFKLEHRLGEYNAVQKIFYLGGLFAIVMMIVSGLAIWKPVQLQALTWLFGGFQGARLVHFLFMSAITLFLVVHVTLVILVPKTFVAMVTGRATARPHGAPARRVTVKQIVERRSLLRGTLSLGAVSLLGGCDISDSDAVQKMLAAFSRWNDRVQAALFSGTVLAPEFPESEAVSDFRYNAYFPKQKAPVLNADDYKLELSGLIADKHPWSVDQLHALPQKSQVTRHVCVEGWSMIGKWTGTPLRVFLERVGADTTAKYVGFTCADGYYEGIDMPSALHPQTIMAYKLSDRILPSEFGFPFKLRIPTKLGFKNPKWITSITVTNRQPPGFWTDRGYNWFSGI